MAFVKTFHVSHVSCLFIFLLLLFLQYGYVYFSRGFTAVIAQLGERKTEDLKVSGSIPDCGNAFVSQINVFCPSLRNRTLTLCTDALHILSRYNSELACSTIKQLKVEEPNEHYEIIIEMLNSCLDRYLHWVMVELGIVGQRGENWS